MNIPKTFTAAVLTKVGFPLEIISGIKIPSLHKGQVLVKVAYAGVCHSQLMEARGLRGDDPWIPHMLGHEGTGVVVAIGEGVSKVSVGDNVVLGWIKGSGLEAGGCRYIGPDGKTINSGGVTTFSNYTVASENRLVKLPEGSPMDIGVLYGCALPTGAGIILNTARPNPESSVAIIGLGGIGLSALMAARSLGVSRIYAVDVEPKKLSLARDIGASCVINPNEINPVLKIGELTGGAGVDFAIEAAGTVNTIELAFELTRKNGGRCIFASHPPHGERIRIDPFDLICGKNIEGSWGGASNPDEDIALLGRSFREGRLPLQKLLGRPYKLNEINQALSHLENRLVSRAIVDMQELHSGAN